MTLAEAITEMQAILDRGGGDLELDHGDKDVLLARVVRDHLGEEGSKLADIYDAIGGWYA